MKEILLWTPNNNVHGGMRGRLYGSDWSLSKMEVYRVFILEAVPKDHYQAILSDNAKDLFKLLLGKLQSM